MFFFRFPERYLCTIYKMKKKRVGFGVDCFQSGNNGNYIVRPESLSDPLAIMLVGTKVHAGVYGDFANEFAIPLPALDVFQNALSGRLDRGGAWSRANPVASQNLVNFGTAVYFIREACPTDAKLYLDRVPDLIGKDKMKEIASAIYVPETKPKKKPVGLEAAQYHYQVAAAPGNGYRLW